MKKTLNILWALMLLVIGFGVGAFFIVGSKNTPYYSFDYYLEEFIIGGISFVLTMLIVAIVSYIIVKLIKAKNRFKIILYVVTIITFIFGVRSYFLVDDVLLIKKKAIIWEKNEEELRKGVTHELQNKGYNQTKSNECAECIISDIMYDDDFFRELTEQNDLLTYLLGSDEYIEYFNHCINKSEMSYEEQEDEFEKQMKELLEE